MIRKLLIALFAILIFGALIVILTVKILEPVQPEAEAGPEAQALAKKIENAIRINSWRNTAAVSFVFTLRGNRHFRDLQRDFVEVVFGAEGRETRVLYDNRSRKYIAFQRGDNGERRLDGAEAAKAFELAYKYHVNDIFWLNPFVTFGAPGAVVKKAGDRALLLTFESGGVTPGDAYLIVTDESGLPQRWNMWVQILPLKGLEFTFENWIELETGAMVALDHKGSLAEVTFSDVKAYARYPVAGGNDRFQPLVQMLVNER